MILPTKFAQSLNHQESTVSTYILLMSLTSRGRRTVLDNPDTLLSAQAEIKIPQTQMLGLYAVLGEYDFMGIVEAPDNEAAARFSMALGVAVGVRIRTLPAIPIGRLDRAQDIPAPELDIAGVRGPFGNGSEGDD